MTELSPQAQAVWDAYERVDCDPYEIDPRKAGLSAALETVADQVVPVELHPQAYEDCCQYSDVQTRAGIRANLLAIAAELRHHNANLSSSLTNCTTTINHEDQ